MLFPPTKRAIANRQFASAGHKIFTNASAHRMQARELFMESQPVAIRTTTSAENGQVQEVVRRAHEELRQLLQQRAEVMRRIRTIKRTIDALANLFGDVVLSEELLERAGSKSNGRQAGFTKACRMILMDANRALSARCL